MSKKDWKRWYLRHIAWTVWRETQTSKESTQRPEEWEPRRIFTIQKKENWIDKTWGYFSGCCLEAEGMDVMFSSKVAFIIFFQFFVVLSSQWWGRALTCKAWCIDFRLSCFLALPDVKGGKRNTQIKETFKTLFPKAYSKIIQEYVFTVSWRAWHLKNTFCSHQASSPSLWLNPRPYMSCSRWLRDFVPALYTCQQIMPTIFMWEGIQFISTSFTGSSL